jgi:hypothetical protein
VSLTPPGLSSSLLQHWRPLTALKGTIYQKTHYWCTVL